ncbi:MAG TPA: hypothetical protein VD902_01250, partial [Symbiobacteriaceae bacterium]|nr:hypothetical protein [Symbiobacteriaceae bacterium]
SGGKITANGKNIWTVELSFNAPASQVGDFYAKFLSEKGVTDPWRMDNDDEQETSSSITGGTDTFNVIVMAYMPKEAGEEGQLSLQWQEK